MSTLNAWDTIDANNNAAPPDGWPEATMNYSEVNDAGRAVQGTLKRYFADINGSLVAGGVADAYTVTLNESGYTAYFTGMYFACRINTTNTGASTINVNAIGVKNIVDRAGAALDGGEITAGGIYEFRYDGVNVQLMGTIIGSQTINGALTVTGAFTSLGIDDNATGERLQLSDTAITLGAAGTNYSILNQATDQFTALSGGSAFNLGGNLLFYGESHATLAGDVSLRSGANPFAVWDESAGSLTLSTGVGVKTTALTIDSSQVADFASPIKTDGITFPATQVASANANTLDDYEEGTWTVGISDTSKNASEGVTYTARAGSYTKIGREVYIHGFIQLSSLGTLTGTDTATLIGLPFTVSSSTEARSGLNITYTTNTTVTAGQNWSILLDQSASTGVFFHWNSAVGTTGVPVSALNATTVIWFQGSYFID